jgi:Bifunctional DNA primase/polymerase, N-terminal
MTLNDLGRVSPGELLAALGELGCAQAARVYAALGYPVVPMHAAQPGGGCSCPDPGCPEAGKHPRLRGWQRLAAVDPAVVGEWWRRWPQANLGLATGRAFDVLDLDGQQGVEALRAAVLINPAEHPGPVARTGGGGWHLLYAPTALGNRVGLLCGVDWRGRGGLIVAPPSQHVSGRRYHWVRPPAATLPAVPPALERLLAPPATQRTTLPPQPPTRRPWWELWVGGPRPGAGRGRRRPDRPAQRDLEPGRVQPGPAGRRRSAGS